MTIDLGNVDESERIYIKQEGDVTLKVIKVTEGETANRNPQIKVHFQDRFGNWAFDDFVITENALWKMKAFTKALKLPDVVDTNTFAGRYVKATFKAKKTTNGEIFEIKKYEPSPLMGETVTPNYGQNYVQNKEDDIAQQGGNYQTPAQHGEPSDDDKIPF